MDVVTIVELIPKMLLSLEMILVATPLLEAYTATATLVAVLGVAVDS